MAKDPDIPDDVRELGEALGMSYALRIQALGNPALQRVAATLGQLQGKAGALSESQNSGCQNGQCRRQLLDELLDTISTHAHAAGVQTPQKG